MRWIADDSTTKRIEHASVMRWICTAHSVNHMRVEEHSSSSASQRLRKFIEVYIGFVHEDIDVMNGQTLQEKCSFLALSKIYLFRH